MGRICTRGVLLFIWGEKVGVASDAWWREEAETVPTPRGCRCLVPSSGVFTWKEPEGRWRPCPAGCCPGQDPPEGPSMESALPCPGPPLSPKGLPFPAGSLSFGNLASVSTGWGILAWLPWALVLPEGKEGEAGAVAEPGGVAQVTGSSVQPR